MKFKEHIQRAEERIQGHLRDRIWQTKLEIEDLEDRLFDLEEALKRALGEK